MTNKTLDQLTPKASAVTTDLLPIWPVGGPLESITFANLVASLGNYFNLLAFGAGSDGNVTINGAVNLQRDMFYNNLTLLPGAALNTRGNRIFVAGTLDLTAAPAGAIQNNASNGSNSIGVGVTAVGGTGPNASVGATDASQTGVTGAGVGNGTSTGAPRSGVSVTTALTTTPVNGGAAGVAPAGGAGSSGGSGSPASSSVQSFGWTPAFPVLATQSVANLFGAGIVGGMGGGAGGSGGGDGTNPGGTSGGGGGGGGILFIAARFVKRTGGAVLMIQAAGGNGGAGSAAAAGNTGGAGGSSGGGGGWVVFMVGQFLDTTPVAAAIGVGGGAGAAGSNAHGTGLGGDGAGSGQGGTVTIINLAAGTIQTTLGPASMAGTAHAGATGGAGAAANTAQIAL